MILTIIFIVISFLFFPILITYAFKGYKLFIIPINWPLVGMFPHLMINIHCFYDYSLDVISLTNDKTFLFKGPWFTSMEYLFTTNPANVHHILSKNFINFPKGAKFNESFEILGDGIFNVDSGLWKDQRKNLHSFLTNPRFNEFLVETVGRKVEDGLIPILEHATRVGHVVDLENLFQRFTFDTICAIFAGHDPRSMSVDLPETPVCKALDEVEEAIFHRYTFPEAIWKLQRWLCVGKEKKLAKAWETIDTFIYKYLTLKVEEGHHNKGMDWMSSWLMDHEKNNSKHINYKFSRDMYLSMLIAGRDTTSVALTWFFYLVLKNPKAEKMIREEVKSIASQNTTMDLDKLVYLHGALCETLRLYPSVPSQIKAVAEEDVLPSGHKVGPRTQIVILLHTMGRSKSLWGEDCLEFKPERWITERGRIKHEPSYKFPAFNGGPRTCLGKEMAFIQMKAVVFAIFCNGYKLKLVEENVVEPSLSIILHTKNGLKVMVSKSD